MVMPSLRPSRLLRRWAWPAALGAAAATEAALNPEIAGGSGLPAVFAAAMALPLVWRDEQPAGALAGTLGVFAISEIWGTGTLSEAALPFVVLVVAMYAAGVRLRGGWFVGAVCVSYLTIGGTIVHEEGFDADGLVYALIVVMAAFAAGRLVGQRTREAHRLSDEKSELERAREERERAAVARERMRIAQELHDLITHRVSAMVLQASTERHISERQDIDPATLRSSLASIETLGREAMSELRQLLGTLFHEGDEPRTPQPSMRDLHALVAQTPGVESAGLTIAGTERPLPPPVEVSLYRLTQEALSNAMRHATGTAIQVTVDYRPDAVELTVANGGGGSDDTRPDAGLGLGIPGMRERVRQLGGTLVAEKVPTGGFVVRALIPAPANEEAP